MKSVYEISKIAIKCLLIIYSGLTLSDKVSVNLQQYKQLSKLILTTSESLIPSWNLLEWNTLGHCSNSPCQIICKYFIFVDEDDTDDTRPILFLIFCHGEKIVTTELDILWNYMSANIIHKIKLTDYKQIIISGHSTGAAMSYYFTLKLFFDNVFKDIDMSSLYIILFGLGRIPTPLIYEFKQLFMEHNFNVLDIITYDETLNLPDKCIDYITLSDERCNIGFFDLPSHRPTPLYCNNDRSTPQRIGKPPINNPKIKKQIAEIALIEYHKQEEYKDSLLKKLDEMTTILDTDSQNDLSYILNIILQEKNVSKNIWEHLI